MGELNDLLRCPFCGGALKPINEPPRVVCKTCNNLFMRNNGTVNFVDSKSLDDFAKHQKDIYEGAENTGYTPQYLVEEQARRHTELSLEAARDFGLIMPNWLGVKCKEIADKISPAGGERLLDVGCGFGLVLNSMSAIYGTDGVGVDFSASAVSAGASFNPCGNEYYVADALRLPFQDGSFDIAVSFGVIEHVTDPRRMAHEMLRVLKPGGRLMIYTLRRSDKWSWHWWQRQTSRSKYGLGVDNQWGHDRNKFLEPGELEGYLKEQSCREVNTYTIHSLYTLMFDEIFPGMVSALVRKPKLFKIARSALELADAPVSERGYGNEFVAVAWKEQEDASCVIN